ncbi:unnamed protein product [Meloidogyne enterolobii]|uniref:Uncharacterized protein n=1 Tax=Meloidogyne enterolobii TaxID=390850 RepID=A0ACB0ZGR3_MELEN
MHSETHIKYYNYIIKIILFLIKGLHNKDATDRLVKLIGAKYRAYDIIYNKLQDGGYKEPLKSVHLEDEKDLENVKIVEQTETDVKALEESRKLEKFREDKNAEISLINILNEEKEKYYMENVTRNIFMGEESSSRNIIIDHSKLAIKLELKTWFDDYYNKSNKVVSVGYIISLHS